MDDLITSWKTTTLGLLAGLFAYARELGAVMPTTRDQWAAAGFAVALMVWGAISKDPK